MFGIELSDQHLGHIVTTKATVMGVCKHMSAYFQQMRHAGIHECYRRIQINVVIPFAVDLVSHVLQYVVFYKDIKDRAGSEQTDCMVNMRGDDAMAARKHFSFIGVSILFNDDRDSFKWHCKEQG